MKVYVAFDGEYEQRGIIGVYADRADAIAVTMPHAIAWREKMLRERRWSRPDIREYSPVSEDDCDVEEHELVQGTRTGP